MTPPSLHLAVPTWVLFATTLADVGLVTFGDPAALGAPEIATPLFKAAVAMLGVALAVMVARPSGGNGSAPVRGQPSS